jgi:hypothetical protein
LFGFRDHSLPLSQDVQAQRLDHHDMPRPRASLCHLQMAVDGRCQEAFFPSRSEEPFKEAEVLEMVAEWKRFGAIQQKGPSLKDLLHRAGGGTMFAQIFRGLAEDTLKMLPSL